MIIFSNFFKKLREKKELEDFLRDVKRKGTRLLVGTFLIFAAIYVQKNYGIDMVKNITLILVSVMIISDTLRLTYKIQLPYLEPFVIHPYEKVGLQGTTFAITGCLLAYYAADFDIAITAIAMFMYGDAAAGLVGERFGAIKILKRKSLEGSMTMFLVALLAGWFLQKDVFLLLFMAILATMIELFFQAPADDLALPLFVSLGGQCIAGVFAGRACPRGYLEGIGFFVACVIIAVVAVWVFERIKKIFT